jgi:hypothetical protein
MKKLFLLFIIIMSQSLFAQYAIEDVQKIKNDKETQINTLKRKEIEEISTLYPKSQVKKLTNLFNEVVLSFLNAEHNKCELNLIETIITEFKAKKIKHEQIDLINHFKMLRINHAIDDLLLEILITTTEDYFNLKKIDLENKTIGTLKKHNKLLENNDIQELYSNFAVFPDEVNQCLYQEFTYIKNRIKNKNNQPSKKPLKIMEVLNKKALKAEVIDLATYNKLDYLTRKSNLSKRYVWLKDYFTIIFNAKNQMVPISKQYQVQNIEDESKYPSKVIHRRSKLTQRKLLYRKYNETQIIMLAQVLQKASRRMGVDSDTITSAPVITQEFSILQPNGERETYVEQIEIDPQSQFNLARRLLRKDILDLQMMDNFTGLKITFDDVVMAAYETGYISIDDINYVVKYDDLWNPQMSKYQKYKGFIVRVAGYSTFFLPPPWNIIATIAIGVTDSVIDNRYFTNGADNDNAATFIE